MSTTLKVWARHFRLLMKQRRVQVAASISLFFLLLILLYNSIEGPDIMLEILNRPADSLAEGTAKKSILTAQGRLHYTEVNRNVWKKFGYHLVQPSYPLVKLEKINRDSCRETFAAFLEIAYKYRLKPKKVIPSHLYDAFLSYNYSDVAYSFNVKFPEWKKIVWDKIPFMVKYSRDDFISLVPSSDGKALLTALRDYRHPAPRVLVDGSRDRQPWKEVAVLREGATFVQVLDFQGIWVKGSKVVNWTQPHEYAENHEVHLKEYDIAIAFSSIEHIGLNKFGDALDAHADFREMEKIRCVLKRNGHLFLTIPIGADRVIYNSHRVYGRIRLPMLFAGYEHLATYYKGLETPVTLRDEMLTGKGSFFTFVLRKI